MAWIATDSEAYGFICCTIYTSQGEVAALRLSLPLPQGYSQLLDSPDTSLFSYKIVMAGGGGMDDHREISHFYQYEKNLFRQGTTGKFLIFTDMRKIDQKQFSFPLLI